jgi:hypothetical protein
VKRDAGSNQGRWLQIGRPGLKGAQGGGAGSPETISRGGARLGSPDFALNGAPGVKTTRARVWEVQRSMRDSPRATAGLGEGSSGAHDDGGGSTRRRIGGARVPAAGAGLGP